MLRVLHCLTTVMPPVAAAVLLVGSAAADAPAGQLRIYVEDFEHGNASNWWADAGWAVRPEGAGFVYRGAGNGHAHSGYDATVWGDSTLKLRFTLAGDVAHISYRHHGAERYFLSISETETTLRKQVDGDTVQEDLAGGPGISYGDWHTIEIAMTGDTLTALIDDRALLEYQDPIPLAAGGFSVESFEAELLIDDVEVWVESSATTPPSVTWHRTGGPQGGLGYDIRAHPDNPDLMYVSDAFAGVFRSTNGGANWTPINDGISARSGESADAVPVFCLTIDPNNPDIVWIGTQGVRGVFKSVNGGDLWEERVHGIVEQEGITVRGLTVDPGNSQVVYLAAEIASWIWNGSERRGREFDLTQGVVYKSTDGGDTWAPVWRGDNLARYLWIDPRDTNVLYLSTGIFDREAANSDPDLGLPGGEGILKSTDGGQVWFPVNQGLGNLYVGSLYMQPDNPDVLLAGTGSIQYSGGGGAYLSTNGGASWQQTLSGDILEAVEFSTSDPDVAYAGNDRTLYHSSDGGHTWSVAAGGSDTGWGPAGVRAGFPIDFQVDPRDPDRLFANNYGGGNFVSADRGRTWAVASRGYTGAQTRAIAVDPAAAGTVFAAARSGLYGSSDGGEQWIGLSYPPTAALEWQVVAVDPDDSNHLLAANNWHPMIWQSHDRGHTWLATGNPSAGDVYFQAIAFAPSDASIVYAGSAQFYSAGAFDTQLPADGVFVSRDGGAGWAQANDALSANAHVVALAIAPSNPEVVYAATGTNGVIKTASGGRSWTALNEGLPPSAAALTIVMHPTDSEVLLTGLEMGGIYRSDDGGASWQSTGFGMNPQASVSDIVFHPADPAVLFAADRLSGVYRSGDGGALWQPMSDGLRTRAVNDLAMSSDGRQLYAATEGEGVFRLDLEGAPPAATEWPHSSDPTPDDTNDNDSTPPPGGADSGEQSNGGGTGGPGSCGGGMVAALGPMMPMLLVLRRRKRAWP